MPAIGLALLPTALSVAAAPSQTRHPLVSSTARQTLVQDDSSAPVLLAQRSRTLRIRFKPGADSATIRNAVVRGTRDIYLLDAQKGQTMMIKIESLENNAVFDVEAPPSKSGQRRILRQETVSWSGKLPATGDYQIVIGTTRGNASYKLSVTIR